MAGIGRDENVGQKGTFLFELVSALADQTPSERSEWSCASRDAPNPSVPVCRGAGSRRRRLGAAALWRTGGAAGPGPSRLRGAIPRDHGIVLLTVQGLPPFGDISK